MTAPGKVVRIGLVGNVTKECTVGPMPEVKVVTQPPPPLDRLIDVNRHLRRPTRASLGYPAERSCRHVEFGGKPDLALVEVCGFPNGDIHLKPMLLA